MGAQKFRYQVVDFVGANGTELDVTKSSITDHAISKTTDGIDICTLHFIVDTENYTRMQYKETLDGTRFQVIYSPDVLDDVHFDGIITRVFWTDQDKTNLTAIGESLDRVLREYVVGDGNADTGVEGIGMYDPNSNGALKITTVDNGNKRLHSTDTPAAPGGYSSGDHGANIIPMTIEGGSAQDYTTITPDAKCSVGSGVVANLTDEDLSTEVMIELDAGETQTTFTVDFEGTSTVSQGDSEAHRVYVWLWWRKLEQGGQLLLQLYNYDTPGWDTIALRNFNQSYIDPSGMVEIWGYKAGNVYINNADDAFKIRLSITYDDSISAAGVAKDIFRVMEVQHKIYDALTYDNTIMPIASYSSGNYVTLTVAPGDHNIFANDTMILCRKLGDVVQEIFETFDDRQIPFTLDIDYTELNSTYTSVNFRGMRLIDVLDYCLHFTNMHYYFEHSTPRLRFYIESHFHTTPAPPAFLATSAAKMSYDSRTRSKDSKCRGVKIQGAAFRRNDGTEITVTGNYPDEYFANDGSSHLAAYELARRDYQYVKTGTECMQIALSEYDRLHQPDEAWTITLVTYDGDMIDFPSSYETTLEGVYFADIPLTGIRMSYVAADDHLTHQIVLGWHQSPGDEITGVRVNDNKRTSKWLNSYSRDRFSKMPLVDNYITSATMLTNKVQAISDSDKTIVMNAAADEIDMHPGADSTDNSIQFVSTTNTNVSPVIRPSTDLHGWLGELAARWKAVVAETCYTGSVTMISDSDRKIDIGTADIFDFKCGRDSGDPYFRMESQENTAAWPQFRSSADGKGTLGGSSYYLYQAYIQSIYCNSLYRAAFTKWWWLDPRMGNTGEVQSQDNRAPGYFQLNSPDATNGEYWYANGYISIPAGYKAKVTAIIGTAYQTTNFYWSEMLLRIITFDFTTNTRTVTDVKTIANPFSTSTGNQSYYNDSSITEVWFYNYDDDDENVISEIQIRYKVGLGGSPGNWLYLYSHAVKVYYVLI